MNDRISLTGRLGLHRFDIEHNYEGYETKMARIVGVGTEWALQERLAARLEFQYIAGINDRHAAGRYEAISLTADVFYRFYRIVAVKPRRSTCRVRLRRAGTHKCREAHATAMDGGR